MNRLEELKDLKAYVTGCHGTDSEYAKQLHDLIDAAIQQYRDPPKGDYEGAIERLSAVHDCQNEIIDSFTCNGRDNRKNSTLEDLKKDRDTMHLAISALQYCRDRRGGK